MASRPSRAGLQATGMARITEPAQADAVAREHRARGVEATTLHLGTGFEDDDEADRLVAAVLSRPAPATATRCSSRPTARR